MFQLKHLLRFLLFFAISYVALLILGMSLESQYATAYRGLGKKLFQDIGEKGLVQFYPHQEDSGYKLSTKAVVFNKDQVRAARQGGQATVKGAEVFVSSWYNGLLPMIILLSLIFASPVPWKRKLLAFLLGLVFLYLFIYYKLYLSIKFECLQNEWLNLPVSNSGWVRSAHDIFVANIETTFIIPVFIWIAVTFRRRDWRMLVKK